jgi:hypothetical protein
VTLNLPARVTARIGRLVPGRRVGRRCSRAARTGRRCTLTVPARTVRFAAQKGANLRALPVRRLAVGRYLVKVSARANGRSSLVRTVRFTILARR